MTYLENLEEKKKKKKDLFYITTTVDSAGENKKSYWKNVQK